MENDIVQETITINDVLLWDKNPRFFVPFQNSFNIEYDNDDKLIRNLIDYGLNQNNKLECFVELIDSLLNNGFIEDNDYIFVKKINKKYVVLEGNRRVAAVKIINYLKENKSIWIEWFKKIFTNKYYESIKNKLSKFDCKAITCRVFLTNDIEVIKRKVYARDQRNQFGKDFWTRIMWFCHIDEMYEKLKQENMDEKTIIYEISRIFNKPIKKIKVDVKSTKWVMTCLKISKIPIETYKNYSIAPLELASSKIIDPLTGSNLRDLLDLKFDEKENIFKIENEKIGRSFDDLANFLCDSLVKKWYTTRGWNPNYRHKLIAFLYPNIANNENPALQMSLGYLLRMYKKKDTKIEIRNEFENVLENSDDRESTIEIIKQYSEIEIINNDIKDRIKKLNEKVRIFLRKNNNDRTKPSNNYVIHFCAFVDFLEHEIMTEKFIRELNCKTFPFGKFSLIFRNTFIMITNIIFINKKTREYFINKLREFNLDNEFVVENDKIKFIDLLNNYDITSSSEFSSIEKIKLSIFYRSGRNVHGFFTSDNPIGKRKEIIDIFTNNYPLLFNNAWREICNALDIHFNKISDEKFDFFTKFFKDTKRYDYLCSFIHNDKYIVNTYSPMLTENFKKDFIYIKKWIEELNDFIQALI